MKEITHFFARWESDFNEYVKNSNFLSVLKQGNITVFIKEETESENNYRPVSILSNILAKELER